MDKLTGIHAVKEALEARRPIDRIAIAKGRQDTRVEEIVQLARKQGVPVRFEDRGQIDRLANSITREWWRWRRRARQRVWKTSWRTPMQARDKKD